MKTQLSNKGFTLIEIMAVIIIMGIFFTVIIPKMMNLTHTAEGVSVDSMISILNEKEKLSWMNARISEYKTDLEMFSKIIYPEELSHVTETSAVYNEKNLTRKPSTYDEPAIWSWKK